MPTSATYRRGMAYFTNTDGIRFYYQDHGPADGHAVLLVSSWSFDSTMWEYQVPALVAAGYRCVAMDRRGHGRSDEPRRRLRPRHPRRRPRPPGRRTSA